MSEPRTPREMRHAIRHAEEALRLLQEADMMAGDWLADMRFTAARAKLRQIERHFAGKDPDLEPLKPLNPRVHQRPPRGPRRRRYRCTACFGETLETAEHVARHPAHTRMVKDDDGYTRVYCGDWEPVSRMPARKPRPAP